MKKVLFTAFVAAAFAFGMTACNNPATEENTDSAAQTEVSSNECNHECNHECTCEDTLCAQNNCENCVNKNTENCCKVKAGEKCEHACGQAHEGCAHEGEACEHQCEHKCEHAK